MLLCSDVFRVVYDTEKSSIWGLYDTDTGVPSSGNWAFE